MRKVSVLRNSEKANGSISFIPRIVTRGNMVFKVQKNDSTVQSTPTMPLYGMVRQYLSVSPRACTNLLWYSIAFFPRRTAILINCDENKTVVNTSLKSVQTSHDVNLRITQAFSHIGKGYSAIEKFCMVMNIDPFSSTTYGKCARRLDNAYTLASENIFAEIHREIKNVYENGAEITDLSVSFDGTWLTRGHTSLIGVECVIDMLTGYVVDFEVMKKVYGPDIVIKKEECINHVSKRLGTALRSTVKDCRAQGISLGGKAHGSLKEATIKKLTTYYQKAILRNKGDVNAMKTAIYATLFHSISTDAKPQHSKCPAGENSWCFYQSAIANGEKPNNHKLNVGTPINEKFLPKILPIYQRLASNELLERCIRCGTQNANESLHSMIWAKCPKEIFVNKRRVKRAVTEAVCEYNKGYSTHHCRNTESIRCSYWRFNETTCYYLRLSKTKI
ncbi:uncharacterized protein TNCV_304491 [Trichonephila clavipes]|nr:uncharacterized protein TNCV_304491 [Trichonephila clavipes]